MGERGRGSLHTLVAGPGSALPITTASQPCFLREKKDNFLYR